MDEKLKFIEEYRKAKNAATGSEFDSNANVVDKNVATLQTEATKGDLIALNYRIEYEYLKRRYGEDLANQFLIDEDTHVIYPHDSTSIMPYCVSISLYPFLLKGLRELGGTSGAPNHANSFIGGLINLIFLVAGQFAGAVAVPETLPYFDHFLRKDYGEDYISHLDEPVETLGDKTFTLRHKIEDWFQQFVYSINQPAGARNYQSPFTNISYYDEYYFKSIFKDFVFPDGDEPCWETTKELQKMFMKWFNKEREKEVLTFPVETVNLLTDKDTREYKDKEMADFTAEMWSEGHSFFLYQSDSADALSSCCFSKDTKVLARSNNHGISKVYYDTFEHLGKTNDGPDRLQFEVFHNGSWRKGKKISLPNRPMYKIVTANNKEIIVSDNHLNPTLRGDVHTDDLTTDDYLLFNMLPLYAVPEQDNHLTYEQGFAIGAFLGDGSFGSRVELADGSKQIYEVNYSQNVNKYAKLVDCVNKANEQLGGSSSCFVSKVKNNVYPVRISSKSLVGFIQKWTNWKEGTNASNKELNLDCLLQSLDFRRGILDGWYNTDGGNSNRCYTISEKLAYTMEALITSLGMNSIINVYDRRGEDAYIRGEKINHNHPVYCVRWYDAKGKRSMEDVYKVVNNSVYFKIKSIEPVEYDGDIYCFEMADASEPYFTLPNGLITHNCRLRNAIEQNVFSYTLGAGGIETGSKKVITININHVVQDWYNNAKDKMTLKEYITPIVERVHKYLNAWNDYLWDNFNADLLTVYKGGFIDLDKQYLTVGFNGFIEGAEFLSTHEGTEYFGLTTKPDDEKYKQYAKDLLVTIKELDKRDRTEHEMYNCEMVPAESAGSKLYNWDKKNGYWVPDCRNLYNSYFYPVEDSSYDPVTKMYSQGKDFTGCLDGGSAYHCNLDSHLSKAQYRKMMDIAVKAGCNYFTFNIPETICNECGHIDKRFLHECPKCGSKNVDFAVRIIGYLKRVSNFSEVRQAEAKKRYFAHI